MNRKSDGIPEFNAKMLEEVHPELEDHCRGIDRLIRDRLIIPELVTAEQNKGQAIKKVADEESPQL